MSGLRYAGPEHRGPVGERVPLDHRDPLKTLRQHMSGQQPGQPGSHHHRVTRYGMCHHEPPTSSTGNCVSYLRAYAQ
ncbi:hypothetical protein ACWGCP_29285 [Streptomyces niveus]|uniref:hypothetical protein n=1 Tax=Streptomyces niveus TaxID=193462 RepID=UPI0036A36A85